jgi:hypothetical protein
VVDKTISPHNDCEVGGMRYVASPRVFRAAWRAILRGAGFEGSRYSLRGLRRNPWSSDGAGQNHRARPYGELK